MTIEKDAEDIIEIIANGIISVIRFKNVFFVFIFLLFSLSYFHLQKN